MSAPTITFTIKVNFSEIAGDAPELITERDLEAAASSGLALMKVRIQSGRRSDGMPFAPYSTKPIYIPLSGVGTGNPLAKPRGGRVTKGTRFVHPKAAAKAEATGTKAKTQKREPKTMYFEGGYAEFREKNGRGADPVNFTLSGNTTGKRFRVISRSRERVICGWPAGSEQAIVAAALDDREGGLCFSWSDQEINAVLDSILGAVDRNTGGAGSAAVFTRED